jgi:hypothetical protein
MGDSNIVNNDNTVIPELEQPNEETSLLNPSSDAAPKQRHYFSSTLEEIPPPKSIVDVFEHARLKPAKSPVYMKTVHPFFINSHTHTHSHSHSHIHCNEYGHQ